MAGLWRFRTNLTTKDGVWMNKASHTFVGLWTSKPVNQIKVSKVKAIESESCFSISCKIKTQTICHFLLHKKCLLFLLQQKILAQSVESADYSLAGKWTVCLEILWQNESFKQLIVSSILFSSYHLCAKNYRSALQFTAGNLQVVFKEEKKTANL